MVVRQERREFLLQAGGGLSGLAVAQALGAFSPSQARAAGAALEVLSEDEGRTFEALGEVLLPGAAAAGIAHYVDHQLASAAPLLMLQYLDFPMASVDFYRQGLAALDALAGARHASAFADLEAAQQVALVGEIAQGNPADWAGPPAPLFYFATRNDAVDVVYGTQAGFEALQVPYMAHILPASDW